MQTKGQEPELLPADLWSAVLSHLPTASRMSARLVCKLFSTFGPRETLHVCLATPSAHKAQSLMLLLARKANFEGAPIHLKLPDLLDQDGAEWMRPCLYISLQCSGLRQLDLQFHINFMEAASLLEVLPATLDDLIMSTDTEAVSLQAWFRLTCLKELMLILKEGTSPGPHKPSGLAGLKALSLLSLQTPPGQLAASSFFFPALKELHFDRDPFDERLDLLHNLPALERLWFTCTSDDVQLPAWAVGHQSTLKCSSIGALSSVCPTSLLCKELILHANHAQQHFFLRCLLEMPHLRGFIVNFREMLKACQLLLCVWQATKASITDVLTSFR